MTLYDDDQGTYKSTQMNVRKSMAVITRQTSGGVNSGTAGNHVRIARLNPIIERGEMQLRSLRGGIGLSEDPVDMNVFYAAAADAGSPTVPIGQPAVWTDHDSFRVVTAAGIVRGSSPILVEEDPLNPPFKILHKYALDTPQQLSLYVRSDVASVDFNHNCTSIWNHWIFQNRIRDDTSEFQNDEEWEEAVGWGLNNVI